MGIRSKFHCQVPVDRAMEVGRHRKSAENGVVAGHC